MRFNLTVLLAALLFSAAVACGSEPPASQPQADDANGSAATEQTAIPASPIPTPTSFTASINELMVRETVEAGMPDRMSTPVSEAGSTPEENPVSRSEQEESLPTVTQQSPTAISVVTDENDKSDKQVNGSVPPVVAQASPTPEPPIVIVAPLATATPTVTAEVVPTEEPVNQPADKKVWHQEFQSLIVVDKTERTPQEIGELLKNAPETEGTRKNVLIRHRDNGIQYLGTHNVTGIIYGEGLNVGEKIRVYSSPTEWQEFTCGPEIGTSLDPSVNPTHTEYSHFLFVYSEISRTYNSRLRVVKECIGVSKYVDWANPREPHLKPLTNNERHLFTRKLFDDFGYMGDGDAHIVFKYQVEDRSFTPEPTNPEKSYVIQSPRYAYMKHPETLEPQNCALNEVPNALWSDERGFVGVTIDDMRTLVTISHFDVSFSEESIPAIEKAREEGFYFVHMDGHIGNNNHLKTCWRVVNADEVPYEPCLSCQYWAHYRR